MLGSAAEFSVCLQVSHDFLFPESCGPPQIAASDPSTITNLELRLRFLFEITRLARVPAARTWNGIALFVKLHSEIEPHAIQDVLDLIERFLPEVLGGQHLALRALHQIANGPDVGILEAVVRAHRKF